MSLRTAIFAPLRYIEAHLTVYTIFAITTIIMVWGHWIALFDFDRWLRMPDRIVVPFFLIAFGYNAGRRLDKRLLISAAAVLLTRFVLFHGPASAVAQLPASIPCCLRDHPTGDRAADGFCP